MEDVFVNLEQAFHADAANNDDVTQQEDNLIQQLEAAKADDAVLLNARVLRSAAPASPTAATTNGMAIITASSVPSAL